MKSEGSLTVAGAAAVTFGAAASDFTLGFGTSGKLNLPNVPTLNLNGTTNTVINSLGGTYVLGSDINAAATSALNSGAGFTGTMEGLGHSVNSLTINRPASSYVGLFGKATGGSVNGSSAPATDGPRRWSATSRSGRWSAATISPATAAAPGATGCGIIR
ncbi:MAG: hypothetical protein WCJ64_23590 [Rhodospirillaceae bacterium]